MDCEGQSAAIMNNGFVAASLWRVDLEEGYIHDGDIICQWGTDGQTICLDL